MDKYVPSSLPNSAKIVNIGQLVAIADDSRPDLEGWFAGEINTPATGTVEIFLQPNENAKDKKSLHFYIARMDKHGLLHKFGNAALRSPKDDSKPEFFELRYQDPVRGVNIELLGFSIDEKEQYQLTYPKK